MSPVFPLPSDFAMNWLETYYTVVSKYCCLYTWFTFLVIIPVFGLHIKLNPIPLLSFLTVTAPPPPRLCPSSSCKPRKKKTVT